MLWGRRVRNAASGSAIRFGSASDSAPHARLGAEYQSRYGRSLISVMPGGGRIWNTNPFETGTTPPSMKMLVRDHRAHRTGCVSCITSSAAISLGLRAKC